MCHGPTFSAASWRLTHSSWCNALGQLWCILLQECVMRRSWRPLMCGIPLLPTAMSTSKLLRTSALLDFKTYAFFCWVLVRSEKELGMMHIQPGWEFIGSITSFSVQVCKIHCISYVIYYHVCNVKRPYNTYTDYSYIYIYCMYIFLLCIVYFILSCIMIRQYAIHHYSSQFWLYRLSYTTSILLLVSLINTRDIP